MTRCRFLISRSKALRFLTLASIVSLGLAGCYGVPDFTMHCNNDADVAEVDAYHEADVTEVDAYHEADVTEADAYHDAGATEAGVCEEGKARCDPGEILIKCRGGIWQEEKKCDAPTQVCDSLRAACRTACRTTANCADAPGGVEQECRGDGRCASKTFETVWEVPFANYKLRLPYYKEKDNTCDFTIWWGDEATGTPGTRVTNCNDPANLTHTYSKNGIYHVKIQGTYNGWGMESAISCSPCTKCSLAYLKKVVSFGPVGLTSGAFACTNEVVFPEHEVPDASKWTNGKELFQRARGIDRAVSRWDTSRVNTMSAMFREAYDFNVPLGNWNTSNVVNMSAMFNRAVAFNQPIGSWNTSKVTTMSAMFNLAVAFNQPIGSWNISNNESLRSTFAGATSFNQDLDNWNTSKVTNMNSTFYEAVQFNKPLKNWNTSNVTTMQNMFFYATAFNQPLDNWITSQVTDMRSMFGTAVNFDQNLVPWDVSKVSNMSGIFSGSGITQPNYCAVKSLPVWVNYELGVSFDCP